MVDQQAFGLPIKLQGIYHATSSPVSIKQALQLLMATENHMRGYFVPSDSFANTTIRHHLSSSAFQNVIQAEETADERVKRIATNCSFWCGIIQAQCTGWAISGAIATETVPFIPAYLVLCASFTPVCDWLCEKTYS